MVCLGVATAGYDPPQAHRGGGTMAKQLVVCCDGTWNVPDQLQGGVAAPTNVAKLALGIATGEGSGQLLYYEPGVGTTPDERIAGGAFGYGLSRNIRNCYR